MQHLAGDITAVGEITQESGQMIGTALRTIYSRVTTHKDSIEILDELGISIRRMGENGTELRDVSDILADLGAKWQDLSSAEQQAAGLAIAGRSRLTQLTNKLSHIEMCA